MFLNPSRNMSPTITIHEAALILNCRDHRTVYRWCKKRGIKVYAQPDSRQKYIMRKTLEFEFMRDFIEDLQFEYGEQWMDAYHAYTSPRIEDLLAFNENKTKNMIDNAGYARYSANGKHEIEFLNKLKARPK